MLKSLHFNDLKQRRIEEPDSLFYIVSRDKLDYIKFNSIRDCPVLAPSEKLARMVRLGDISPGEFKKKYQGEFQSPIVRELSRYLRTEAQNKNIYIVENSEDGGLMVLDMLDQI
jgi:hypothetical protein